MEALRKNTKEGRRWGQSIIDLKKYLSLHKSYALLLDLNLDSCDFSFIATVILVTFNGVAFQIIDCIRTIGWEMGNEQYVL